MSKPASPSDTRQQLLRAALKLFANSGYAATSVQDIVDEAKLSKPALYYHFKDKAGLFQALVHAAHDERYRVLHAAVEQQEHIGTQLEAGLSALFTYFRRNRELMRISFATMFAAPGEVPPDAGCDQKCRRNYEFMHALLGQAQKRGELSRRFSTDELTFGLYGLANLYFVSHLVSRSAPPNELTAQRIVRLFLAGAGAKTRAKRFQPSVQGRK
ncbi:MAG: TetR/AcrR family transcriptional regulator [Verrucomicrobiae bacterium]|nr:TetR/AcrR family transcriptional regulator [Verrucomicrobiae bacterium]